MSPKTKKINYPYENFFKFPSINFAFKRIKSEENSKITFTLAWEAKRAKRIHLFTQWVHKHYWNILTESTRFFFLYFNIFSRCRRQKSSFFLCCMCSHCYCEPAHNRVRFQPRRRLEKLFSFSILSPGIVVYFRESIVFVFFTRERSLRATCWLAFNIFPFFQSSNFVLDIHTLKWAEREKEWRRKSEKLYTEWGERVLKGWRKAKLIFKWFSQTENFSFSCARKVENFF